MARSGPDKAHPERQGSSFGRMQKSSGARQPNSMIAPSKVEVDAKAEETNMNLAKYGNEIEAALDDRESKARARHTSSRRRSVLSDICHSRNPYQYVNMQSKARMHDKSTEPLRTFAKAESACHHLGHPSTSAAILQAPDLKGASAVRWMLGPQSPRVKSNGATGSCR